MKTKSKIIFIAAVIILSISALTSLLHALTTMATGEAVSLKGISLDKKYTIKNYSELTGIDEKNNKFQFNSEAEVYKSIIDKLRLPKDQDAVVIGYTKKEKNGLLIVLGAKDKIKQFIEAQSKLKKAEIPAAKVVSEDEKTKSRTIISQNLSAIFKDGKKAPKTAILDIISKYNNAAAGGTDKNLAKEMMEALKRLQ